MTYQNLNSTSNRSSVTMKARELTRRAKSRNFPINGLLDELLYMILERLDKQDLLNLGLVSRGIYLRVASVLYKDIELNL
jgi:hypothetical protein